METQVRIKPVYNRRKATIKVGETAPIHIEVYFSRDKRIFLPTNINLLPSDWGNSGKYLNKVKPSHPNYIELNYFIANKIAEIENISYSCYNAGKPFTPEILADFLDNKFSTLSFYDHYDKQYTADESSISVGTRKEHRYTLNVLKEYKKTCLFSELTFEFVQGFDRFLRNKGLAQNTIHKHHKHISRYLNIAIKLKYFKSEDNPYLVFKSKKVKGTRENLDRDEYEAIKNKKFGSSQRMVEYARDLFIFGCTTGLRFGDIMNLTSDNTDIKYDKDKNIKEVTIRTTMEKVDHSRNIKVVLPLHLLFDGLPLEIFKKYDQSSSDKERRVFKQVTNQEVNRQLKAIAIACDIDSLLSFHVSRHTFGTFLADITANPYLIMELMGHADISTSMIYIHQSEERLLNNLRNIASWNPKFTETIISDELTPEFCDE